MNIYFWTSLVIAVIAFTTTTYSIKIIHVGVTNTKWSSALTGAWNRSGIVSTGNIILQTYQLKLDESGDAPTKYTDRLAKVYNYLESTKRQIGIIDFDFIIGEVDTAVQTVLDNRTTPYIVPIPSSILFPSTFCLSPHETGYAAVMERLLKVNNVDKAVVIIDSNKDYDSFFLPLLESQNVFIRIWKADFTNSTAVRKTLMSIRDSQFHNFIIRGSLELTKSIMLQARYLSIVTMPYRWYFASEQCPNFNLVTYTELKTNFTFISDICSTNLFATNKIEQVVTEEDLLSHQIITTLKTINFTVSLEAMRNALVKGVQYSIGDSSSTIKLNERNLHRNELQLKLHTLTVNGLNEIAIWDPEEKLLKFHPTRHEDKINDTEHQPTIYRVVATEEHPHLIVNHKAPLNNGRYRGYGVDLMTELTKRMNATFQVILKEQHGEKNEDTGEWGGVIGSLLKGEADMTLGALVQDKEREDVIDFSTVFMNFEISLVMVRKRESNGLQMDMIFQFLSPFHSHVWICIIAAIVLLSFALWVIETASQKITTDKTEFNLTETSWFIFATTIQGGTELIPRSFAGRILTGTLYFFTLIMISSYTANLAAFLTVQKMDNPISDVRDLANPVNSDKITYGTVKDSAVLEFFEHSFVPEFQTIYKTLTKTNPEWLVEKSEDGFNRSRFGFQNKDYIFIWDYKVAMYEVLQESVTCDLVLVGKPFAKRAIAIGMQQGSLLKEKVDTTLLQMQKENVMDHLENKWWKSAAKCSEKPEDSANNSEKLTLVEMAGVFLVLLGGMVVSFVFLLLQLILTKIFRKLKKEVTRSFSSYGNNNLVNKCQDETRSGADIEGADSCLLKDNPRPYADIHNAQTTKT